MSSQGDIQAGPQWSDVGVSRDGAATLSIALSEDAGSSAEWECRVQARTEHGTFHVGMFRTTSPARGAVPSRLVAICYYPGAKSWLTSWRKRSGGTDLSQARVILATCEYGGTLPGVTPLVSGLGPSATRSFPFQGGIGGAPVQLAATGAALFAAHFQLSDPAGVPGFVQFFDSAAAPVAGAVPLYSCHVGSGAAPIGADPTHGDWSAGPQGRPIVNRLWAAFSSTADTFTPAVAGTFNTTTELGLP